MPRMKLPHTSVVGNKQPKDTVISMIKRSMKNRRLHLRSGLGHLILIFFSFYFLL